MSVHSQLTGLDLHEVYHFVQETDPGAIGSNLYWLKVSTGEVKRRNALNNGWTTVGSVSPLTTKGDIIVFDGTQQVRLPVGNDGDVLQANASEPSGLAWGLGGGGTGGYQSTPPTSETDTGTAGTYSVDSFYYYICVATNFWKRIPLSLFPLSISLTYSSDGDANGVFTFLGKGKNTGGVWSNPFTSGALGISAVPGIGSGTYAGLVDHNTNDQWIGPNAGSYYQFDLGVNQKLSCNKWSFRQRNGGTVSGACDCTLLGSNDGTTFTSIDARTSAQIPQSSNTWASFTITATTPYRYWRIRQAQSDYFTIGELELYGVLEYIP